MALVDVSANPLNVVVQLFFALENAGATQNARYQQTNQALINALPFLPSSLQALLSPITPFLRAPLGSVFSSAWAGQKSAAESFAAGQLQSTAGGGGQSVSNVSCSLAQNGTVLAGVTPAQGANPAGLVIDFHLPGGEFRFSSGPKALKAIRQTVGSWSLHQRSDKTFDDLARMFNAHIRGWINYYGRFYPSALYPTLRHFWAAWRINFDADITVTTPVPTEPFNLTPVAQATLSNASMHPDNVGADFDQFIDDFFTALGNFFTGGNYISDVDWDEQVYSQETDQNSKPAGVDRRSDAEPVQRAQQRRSRMRRLGLDPVRLLDRQQFDLDPDDHASARSGADIGRRLPSARRAGFAHAGGHVEPSCSRRSRHRDRRQLPCRHDDVAEPAMVQHDLGNADPGATALQWRQLHGTGARQRATQPPLHI